MNFKKLNLAWTFIINRKVRHCFSFYKQSQETLVVLEFLAFMKVFTAHPLKYVENNTIIMTICIFKVISNLILAVFFNATEKMCYYNVNN